MNYHGLKMSVGFLFIVAAVISVSLFIGACDNGITNPHPVPPVQTLDIFPVNGAYEVNLNENFYIGGHFRDQAGNPIRGERVYFSVTPDTVGEITPWATTEPDSSNGFETNVVFYGTVEDTVLIRGWIGNESIIALDTMRIWVRPPING